MTLPGKPVTLLRRLCGQMLVLLAFVLAAALPEASRSAASTPTAQIASDQHPGALPAPRAALLSLLPDDPAADPDLTLQTGLAQPPATGPAPRLAGQSAACAFSFASIPPARGPPAV